MAVFSGNPADRATGNVQPGSLREASGMSNGTTRNNNFGGGLGASTRDGGFGSNSGGAGQTVNTAAKGNRLQSVNTAAKGDYLGSSLSSNTTRTPSINRMNTTYSGAATEMSNAITATGVRGLDYSTPAYRSQTSSQYTAQAVRGLAPRSTSIARASTGPVSRGVTASTGTSNTNSARMTGIQDYKSIVPGKVTMTAEKVSFGQKNPSLAKYMGGTPAKPVNVSVEEAKKMASTVSKTGAYVSSANWAAQMGLPKAALSKVGTTTSGYGTTTIKAGPATVGLSYPKSVATGRSFGAYTAGSLSSTGPVSRNITPASSMSTAPFSSGKGSPSAPAPFSNGKGTAAAPAPKPTVQQVRIQSKEKKAATVASRVTKNGYVYTRVGNRLQNFGAATNVPTKDNNRTRRKQK